MDASIGPWIWSRPATGRVSFDTGIVLGEDVLIWPPLWAAEFPTPKEFPLPRDLPRQAKHSSSALFRPDRGRTTPVRSHHRRCDTPRSFAPPRLEAQNPPAEGSAVFD